MRDHWLSQENSAPTTGVPPLWKESKEISRRKAIELVGLGGLGVGLAGCGTNPATRIVSASAGGQVAAAGSPSAWNLEWAGKPVTVSTYSPEGIAADRPVVVALHGMMRNATGMLRKWSDWSDLFGMHVIVPHFDDRHFPGEEYSMGGVDIVPVGTRAIDAFVPMIEQARARMGFTTEKVGLFGHSAGAQLAHRYLMLADQGLVSSAVIAAAGWYTMPDGDTRWPYGLDGTGVEVADLDRCWSTKVLVLVGDQDTGTANLRTSNSAMANGDNRVDRGKAYFERASRVARYRGIPFEWRFELIEGAGHESARAVDRASIFLAA